MATQKPRSTQPSDKPAPHVSGHFDADAFVREDAKPPFRVTRHGREFELLDVRDVDMFRVAEAMRGAADGDIHAAAGGMTIIVPEEDADEFFGDEGLPVALAEGILNAYNAYYGVVSPGKSRASRRSSTGSARQ